MLKLLAMGAAKAMLSAGKQDKKDAKTVDAYFMSGAVRLSRFIRLDEYRKSRMSSVLKAAGISIIAYEIIKPLGGMF